MRPLQTRSQELVLSLSEHLSITFQEPPFHQCPEGRLHVPDTETHDGTDRLKSNSRLASHTKIYNKHDKLVVKDINKGLPIPGHKTRIRKTPGERYIDAYACKKIYKCKSADFKFVDSQERPLSSEKGFATHMGHGKHAHDFSRNAALPLYTSSKQLRTSDPVCVFPTYRWRIPHTLHSR